MELRRFVTFCKIAPYINSLTYLLTINGQSKRNIISSIHRRQNLLLIMTTPLNIHTGLNYQHWHLTCQGRGSSEQNLSEVCQGRASCHDVLPLMSWSWRQMQLIYILVTDFIVTFHLSMHKMDDLACNVSKTVLIAVYPWEVQPVASTSTAE